MGNIVSQDNENVAITITSGESMTLCYSQLDKKWHVI